MTTTEIRELGIAMKRHMQQCKREGKNEAVAFYRRSLRRLQRLSPAPQFAQEASL
jgi:hypothetical protein